MFKLPHIALISHASEVMLKILQDRLQQYVNQELPDFQARFRKGRRTRERPKSQHPLNHRKSKWIPKKIYFCFIDYAKAFMWITRNYVKFFKRWKYQTTSPASWEICMQVKKQQLELDMEQRTGSKLGKEYIKAIYCHPAYLTSMHSTSCEMPGWMRHKLESGLPGKIPITLDMQMTPPLWQKVKKN